MSDQSPELKAAYDALDTAIRDITRLEDWEGLVTDWVVVAANQYFDDDGRSLTDVGQLLPDGGNTVPHYRVLGLLEYAATASRGVIGYVPDDDEEG